MIPTITSPVSHRITWNIDVPDDWIIEKHNETTVEDTLITVYEANSRDLIGQDNMIVSLGTVTWTHTEGTSQEFAEMLVEILRQEPTIHVIHDNIMRSTSLVIFITDGNVLVTQIMVAKQGIGYIVLCAGDADEYKKVSKTCRNIVTSFTLR